MSLARRLVHVLLVVLTLVVGAAAAAIIVSQTAWFKNWLRVYIVREANQYLNGQLSIQRLGGNLFFGVELEDIALSLDGTQVVAVKDLGVDYNVFALIAKGLWVDEIRVTEPVLYLRREGDTWSIARLIKKQTQEADRQGPESPITIDQIGITDASVVFDQPVVMPGVNVPRRFDHLDAKLSFKYEPVRYSIEIAHVSFRGSEPAIGLNALSGDVSIKNDTVYVDRLALRTEETSLSVDGAVQQYLTKPAFNLRLSSDKTSLPELAKVVPALAGIALQPAFELKLDGPLDHLGVDVNVRSSAGQLTGTLVADVVAPQQSVAGDISVRHLDLAPLVGDPKEKSDLAADVRVDVQAADFSSLDSLRGSASLQAPRLAIADYAAENVSANARFAGRRVAVDGRASGYGADATAAGTVTLPDPSQPLSYDVHGTVRRIDLRQLPARLQAPPAETNLNADYHARGQKDVVDAELRFAESIVAGAHIATGSTVDVSMDGATVGYQVDATVSALDLQQIGAAFNMPALAADRDKSTLNGHVTAKGRGTTPKEMSVQANGTLNDSSILGGRVPALLFDASMDDDTAHVKASGSFADFDPAILSGKPAMKGSLAGTLDVDATIAGVSSGVSVDNVAATVTAALEPSTVGGLAIDHASLNGGYHDHAGDIRQLDVVGRDVNIQASGTLAFDDSGASNVTFHADTPSLEEIGALVGIPVTGIGKVDGTITGNRSDLQVAGTLVGDGVKYQENGALTLSSHYSARVPDLAFERARVSADTHATFVTIAGQNINDLTAKTTYADKQVTFDATAKQPKRSLAAVGSVALLPDRQEVHLQRLTLDTQGTTWQLAPGSEPTVQYGQDAVVVKDMRLVSNAQQISADGTLGRPGETLTVTLSDVDLANVDAVLLQPPQLSGTVNASAVISGSQQAPVVKATFQVNRGGFRQFHYDTFGGTVAYGRSDMTVDAKLQENASQWLSVKGDVPTALFATKGAAGGADRIDLTIDSSPIDLGLIQGFTNSLQKVTGTFEAHVRVTGSAEKPEPSGTITLQNGAAAVEPTGVAYKNITGRIDLQPDRVHIDQITALDGQNNALSINGDLAMREGQLGGVEIYVNADDFKVIDNKIGSVRVRGDLEISGDLRGPKIQGDLGVTTGRIDLDQIIALTADSAYATKETEYAAPAADTLGQASAPNLFDALKMDVTLSAPDDFLFKSSNLQTPGSPIGLGALNLTIGGDLHATKDPGDSIVRVRGSVKTIRGTYDFQGRRFDILRDGTVRFDGLDQLDPSLDVRAERLIQSVQTRVSIRGTLSKPEIVLSSSPPLEQADILALIIFNQPVNQLGEGQQISLAARAQSFAAGAVAGSLAQSIGNALKLDTFEIDMAPETGGGPQLTVGQQVSQNLFVKVQQGLGDQSSTNFILEYELMKWLRLQTNVLEGASTEQALFSKTQDSGVDLIFFFSY